MLLTNRDEKLPTDKTDSNYKKGNFYSSVFIDFSKHYSSKNDILNCIYLLK